MGGMAAQIPLKDPEANKTAMEKVRADKEREVKAGHDGTWVAHPGLVPVAREIFEKGMAGRGYKDSQLDYKREEVQVTKEDLLRTPQGSFTYDGFKKNINIGIRYTEAWLRGIGCVPLEGKMEDAATAEISRAQTWQWLRHQVKLDDGRIVTPKLYTDALSEASAEIMAELGPDKYINGSRFPEATTLFSMMIEQEQQNHFENFLTIPAYEHLLRGGK